MAQRPPGHQRFSVFHRFLDMLRERGVARIVGVDRDPEMVEDSRARGFEARVLDARTQLSSLNERFDGVYVSFVIETMDGDEGIAALRDCATRRYALILHSSARRSLAVRPASSKMPASVPRLIVSPLWT